MSKKRENRLQLTKSEKRSVNDFLFQNHGFTNEEYWESYGNWYKGGRGWWALEQGGTGQMRALMWYQHRYKPNSKEWRPKIIIKALLQSLKQEQDR